MLAESWKAVTQETLRNCFRHAGFTLDAETAVSPQVDSVCDELPSADVAFDDLRAAGVSIPAGITFEGFADADKDLELCAELTDDEIIHQVTEDSDDSDTENEEPAPTQPTSSELTRALMTLSSVYSGNMTLTEIEADMIAGKRTVQKKISDFFAPKC
ncbi:tigger transposable element-derived protein 4-like [Dermacentor silvarum]|uniref:tigger transposable element-derived protein 4-like n=1 Tax=Dermacentor silvarum TaxID=543639 RepID=UPI0021007968|nr:tigger transposable element-derived protein 4-like [Dermacentor silvarum]